MRGRVRLQVGGLYRSPRLKLRLEPPVPRPVLGAADGGGLAGAAGKLLQEIRAWHVLPLNGVVAELGTSEETGLTSAEAGERLRRYGENSLTIAAGIRLLRAHRLSVDVNGLRADYPKRRTRGALGAHRAQDRH